MLDRNGRWSRVMPLAPCKRVPLSYAMTAPKRPEQGRTTTQMKFDFSKRNTSATALLLWRGVAARFVIVASLAAGCRETRPGSPALEARSTLPACEGSTPPNRCYPGLLKSAPVVVGPGRIRALMEVPSPGERVAQSKFVVREVFDDGDRILAAGECPDHGIPQSLTLLAEGRTGVVCAGGGRASFGEIAASGGAVEWRWNDRLHHPDGAFPGEIPYAAAIADHVVLVYELRTPKGSPASPGLMLQLSPAATGYQRLCEGESCDTVVTLLAVQGRMHAIWTSEALASMGWYGETIVTAAGQVETRRARGSADQGGGPPIDPRDRSDPCVSQSRNGTVNIVLPGAGRLSYEGAVLPLGPAVYPTELARCPPRRFDDPTPPRLPNEMRRHVRATMGTQWVVAYGLPFVGGPGANLQYPGSLRVVTWPHAP